MRPTLAETALALGDPRATVRCALLYRPGPDPEQSVVVEAALEGHLVLPPRGTRGFGWDPVFLPDGDALLYLLETFARAVAADPANDESFQQYERLASMTGRWADLASLYQVRTGCHGATDLSPVTMGAALHFDTWVPNFGIQEYMRHTEETDAVFPHDYRFEGGYLICGEAPGHGVDIDEDLAARHPYKPAYLPVARLEDGSMWNW